MNERGPMNRRYFLQSAAMAAAAARPAVSASDKVNIAIMGVRGRGRALTGVFGSMRDVNVAYFCEIDPGVVGRAAAVLDQSNRPAPKVVSDIRRVLDDKSV